MQAIIQKIGNNQEVYLPDAILQSLNIQENELLEIQAIDEKIIIMKANRKKRKNIKELFEGYNDVYQIDPSDSLELGQPVGREIW